MTGVTLIVGGRSKTGSALIPLLAQAGLRSRVLSRQPQDIPATGPLIETAQLDLTQPEPGVFANVQAMYLVVPETEPTAPASFRSFLKTATATCRPHVVLLSAIGVDRNESLRLRQVEHAVMDLAPRWTILRSNWFMQNFSHGRYQHAIRDRGELVAPAGDGAVSFIDTGDIAAVAAAAIRNTPTRNQEYTLTGARTLTFAEVAAEIGRAAGRTVRYVQPDLDDLTRMGLPPQANPAAVAALFRRVQEGHEAVTTDDVARVTGRPPKDFTAFAHEHADTWKENPK
jgi:uncharacterized protein YbjT (DUF2867 family)